MKLWSTETALPSITRSEDNHQLEYRYLAEPEQPNSTPSGQLVEVALHTYVHKHLPVNETDFSLTEM